MFVVSVGTKSLMHLQRARCGRSSQLTSDLGRSLLVVVCYEDDVEVQIQHGGQTLLSLFVAAASPLHGGRALRTVPLPLRSLRQADAAVVEPLDGTICIITAHHFSIRNLVADAVSGLVGVVGPVHLAVGLGLWQRRGLLGKLLSQRRRRGARRQRGRGGG